MTSLKISLGVVRSDKKRGHGSLASARARPHHAPCGPQRDKLAPSLDHLVGRHSRNGRLWNATWACRITRAHFSVSSANSFPNSIGDSGIGTLPSSGSRALIFGSARPALISPLSFSTISLGVALGAPTPAQRLTS